MCTYQIQKMVEKQLEGRGLRDSRVLAAIRSIPRHLFVPPQWQARAYEDRSLPIGYGQTISQPYIVGLMSELVRPSEFDRALEIGTGCGYQTAVLSKLVKEVYSIEIVPDLAMEARERLRQLGHTNVYIRCADGQQGWADKAPFEVILVAAAPESIPVALLEQLAPQGRLVIPVGGDHQTLILVEKLANGKLTRRSITPVAFVPMTGGKLPDILSDPFEAT